MAVKAPSIKSFHSPNKESQLTTVIGDRIPFFRTFQFWFNVLAGLLLSLLLSYVFLISNQKIAYIDSAKLMQNYKAMQVVREKVENKTKKQRNNLDTLVEETQKTLIQMERDSRGKNEKQKNDIHEKVARQHDQLEHYQKSVEQAAQKEELAETEKVISKVNAFMANYGKSHSYKMILIASQAGTIAYAEKGLDITDEIVSELNKRFDLTGR